MRPIEDIAHEAGVTYDGLTWAAFTSELNRFAALVRAEALEEAASLTQTIRPCGRGDCDDLASAIRAMKDAHGITAPSAAEGVGPL